MYNETYDTGVEWERRQWRRRRNTSKVLTCIGSEVTHIWKRVVDGVGAESMLV